MSILNSKLFFLILCYKKHYQILFTTTIIMGMYSKTNKKAFLEVLKIMSCYVRFKSKYSKKSKIKMISKGYILRLLTKKILASSSSFV